MSLKLSGLRLIFDKCRNQEKLIKQIHAQATTLGLLNHHQPLACKLLNVYSKLGKRMEAQGIFNQIENPDIVSWTCLIYFFLNNNLPSQAFSIFSDMINNGFRSDGFSIVAALSACGRNKDLVNGKVAHGMVFRCGLGLSEPPILGNSLIDMYSRNGRIQIARTVFDTMELKDVATWTSLLNGFVICEDIESARQLFDEMPQRNTISWTAMIVGYVRGKNSIGALDLFRKMRVEGESCPTSITIVAVLAGCADIGALDFGQSIHGYVNKLAGLSTDVSVYNCLIDMYAKSGSLGGAMKIFGGMLDKDLFTWTTIISGLAFHGKGRYALEVFDCMLTSGVTPNEITYISVLSACSHAGLVHEGTELFNRLIAYYGFEPKIEHYGCMVDLLGRAGHLEEALQLIREMPICPDAVIWRSLLSACLGRGNLDLAEMAGKKVLELEPDDDGVYILLQNMYWSASKWQDILKTRKAMRDQKIKKTPGCSWIEVNGVVHEFVAQDTMHHAYSDGQRKGISVENCSSANDLPRKAVDDSKGEKPVQESTTSSKYCKPPVVYFRRRYQKKDKGLTSTSIYEIASENVPGSVPSLASLVDTFRTSKEYIGSLWCCKPDELSW